MTLRITPLSLPEVLLIEPDVFGDDRGFFLELYRQPRYAEAGIGLPFVQDNHSRSFRGVLRGLHYQISHPQGKLVTVIAGEVFDVAVDVRRGSPTFGRSVSYVLNAADHRQLYIPPGFAHGFCTMSETADFLYKCTDIYRPEDERGVLWSDPQLAIDWPAKTPILSAKDEAFPTLASMPARQLPAYGA
jgi:dTDP-4-dehydrorhamnose 3,5-epimerase